jgi:hypothetical protein
VARYLIHRLALVVFGVGAGIALLAPAKDVDLCSKLSFDSFLGRLGCDPGNIAAARISILGLSVLAALLIYGLGSFGSSSDGY